MVEQMAAVFQSLPLQPVGRAFSIVLTSDARFASRLSVEKSALPNGTWTMPCLSMRNSSLPALNSATALAGSAETVPAFGGRTLGEHGHTHIVAGAVRQRHGRANLLVVVL